LYPVRNPVDHARKWHLGIAEESCRFGCADEPAGRRFAATKDRLPAETLAERLRQGPYTDRFRSADIQGARRYCAVAKRSQGLTVRIPLPNDIDVASREIDGHARQNLPCHIMEHAIAHVDRIVEPEEAAGCVVEAREILKHALPA